MKKLSLQWKKIFTTYNRESVSYDKVIDYLTVREGKRTIKNPNQPYHQELPKNIHWRDHNLF